MAMAQSTPEISDNSAVAYDFTHCLRLKVQIFDTDCYGVMWHGAYTKWLEMARCEFFALKGYPLEQADNDGLVFPVAEQNLKYKQPAKLWDELCLWTTVSATRSRVVFYQQFTRVDETSGEEITLMEATTTCALMQANENGQWRPVRKPPEKLAAVLTASGG